VRVGACVSALEITGQGASAGGGPSTPWTEPAEHATRGHPGASAAPALSRAAAAPTQASGSSQPDPDCGPRSSRPSNLTAGCLVLQVHDECTPAAVVSARILEHHDCAERRFPGAPCRPVWLAAPPCAEPRAGCTFVPGTSAAGPGRSGICAAGLACWGTRMHALS
jgi:hypothetical protein